MTPFRNVLPLGQDLPAKCLRPEPGQAGQVVSVNDDVVESDGQSRPGDPGRRPLGRASPAPVAELFKAVSFGRELHIDRVIEEGDLATAQTHTTGTLTMLEPDTTIELVSRELFVLRKTGSEWRIADYMFNHPERAAS
jgi:hypothetical protein